MCGYGRRNQPNFAIEVSSIFPIFDGHILGPLERVSTKLKKAHYNMFLDDSCLRFRFKSRTEGWESRTESKVTLKKRRKETPLPPFFPCCDFIPHSEKHDLIVAYCGLIQLIEFLLPCNKVGWNLRDFFCNNSPDPIPGQHRAAHFY